MPRLESPFHLRRRAKKITGHVATEIVSYIPQAPDNTTSRRWTVLRDGIKEYSMLPKHWHIPRFGEVILQWLDTFAVIHITIKYLEYQVSMIDGGYTDDILPKRRLFDVVDLNDRFFRIIAGTFFTIAFVLGIIAYPTPQFARISDDYMIKDYWGRGYSYTFARHGVLNQNKYITKTPYKQLTASIVYPEIKLGEDKYFLYKFVPRQIEVSGEKYYAHYDSNAGLYLAKELRYLDVVLPTLIFERDNQWNNLNIKEFTESFFNDTYFTQRYCDDSNDFALCNGLVDSFKYEIFPDKENERFLFRTTVYLEEGLEKTVNPLTQVRIPRDFTPFYNGVEVTPDFYDTEQFQSSTIPVRFLDFQGEVKRETQIKDLDANSYDLQQLFLPLDLEVRYTINQYKDIVPNVVGDDKVVLKSIYGADLIIEFNEEKVKTVQLDQNYDLITLEGKDCSETVCTVEFYLSAV